MNFFIFVVLFAFIGCAFAASNQDQWLESHNYFRSIVNPRAQYMPDLIWSSTVAAYAQAYIDTCPSGHSGGPQGENLYWSSAQNEPWNAVAAWYNEVSNYHLSSNSCDSQKVCGHYTQVVWNQTTHLGCAFANCGSTWAYICSYDPPGNYVGEKPYQACTGSSHCDTPSKPPKAPSFMCDFDSSCPTTTSPASYLIPSFCFLILNIFFFLF